MFVVYKNYRDGGQQHFIGEIIEDITTVKLFKCKISEGKIVEVSRENRNYKALCEYFTKLTGKLFPPVIVPIVPTVPVEAIPEEPKPVVTEVPTVKATPAPIIKKVVASPTTAAAKPVTKVIVKG